MAILLWSGKTDGVIWRDVAKKARRVLEHGRAD